MNKVVQIIGEALGVLHNDSDLEREDPPRDKYSHPYSYDPFTIWGSQSDACNGTAWSDRLSHEKKYDAVVARIQSESTEPLILNTDPKAIEKLLKGIIGHDEIKLLRIVEYCNRSSGYAYFRYDYHDAQIKKAA